MRYMRSAQHPSRHLPWDRAEQEPRLPQHLRLQPATPGAPDHGRRSLRTGGARVITELRVPALRILQGDGREVFSFAVDGKELHRFATVSRVRRDEGAEVRGYQRPEVLAHVGAIRAYLESESPLIPNALVVAFDDCVRFEGAGTSEHRGSAEHGVLVIPIDNEVDDADKPGWIVDGQQRAAAL